MKTGTVLLTVAVCLGAGLAQASDIDDVNDGEVQYSINWSCTKTGDMLDCRGFRKYIRADSPGEADSKFDKWWPTDHPNSTYTGRLPPRER